MIKGKLKGILPDNAKIERLCTGFQFVEGPVWDRRKGRLLFSEIQFDRDNPREFNNELPGNKIRFWSPLKGLGVYVEPSGNSNGLAFDKEGNLVVCEMKNRCLSKIESDGTRHILIDKFNGRRFNAPNDVVIRNDGTIYFTDPEYGIYIGNREIPQQGVYRFYPLKGKLELLIEDFVEPNGLAFSPDFDHLYIIDSARAFYHLRLFNVDKKGDLTGGDIVAQVPGADGMKIDKHGNLYVACAKGVCVLSPSCEHLGAIEIPERPANLAWGGDDWNILYITARSSIYVVTLDVQGVPAF